MEQKELKTPYFLFEKQTIINELSLLKGAIKRYWDNTIIAYSVKTNSLPYLANFLYNQGVYAEVVSEDEYDMVSHCGYTPDHIVCNGPIKSRDFVSKILTEKAIINIDSHAELEYITDYTNSYHQEVEVCLRVNLDIEKYFPNETKAGSKGSRFGFCMENNELNKAITLLKQLPNVKIAGLHLHVSTETRRIEIFQWLARQYATIVKKYDLYHSHIFDIGGGFYGGIPNKPNWNDYLIAISEILKEEGFSSNHLTLIIEPGVSLLASAFSYYMKVIDVKDTNRCRFVVTDGSRIHTDPLFHKSNYFCQYIIPKERNTIPSQEIVGFTCLEYDTIMKINNSREFKVGDIIRLDKLGAYTISLSPLFISYFPAVYQKDENGNISCIRKKWTAHEFIQSSIIPQQI